MFEKRLKEIMKRRAEIRTMLEGNDEVDIDELNRELDALDTEEANLNQRRASLSGPLQRAGIVAAGNGSFGLAGNTVLVGCFSGHTI